MQQSNIVIAGGNSVLGRALTRHFQSKGYNIKVLTRQVPNERSSLRLLQWDGEQLGNWARELDGALAVINMAGRSVDCRYHSRNRRLILDSRIKSTRVLGEAIAQCGNPPSVWLNSSTATIYKHSVDRPMDEVTGEIGATREAKDAFSVEVATAWEEALAEAITPLTRKIALRTAMVLSREGGVFPVLSRLVKLGLGGKMGSGDQYVSWIHEVDFCRAVERLITDASLSGPVNLAAPNPLPNREMMRILREAYHRPVGLPAAQWMLEVGAFFLRTETELIIKSRRVVSERLAAAGFEFEYPCFVDAVRQLGG
jgi:uncharacterized protein (TIGR01777 family)